MFLECWQVPTQCIALQTYQEVHAWIQRLIRSYSFCPSESGRSFDLSSNVCAYISDPATVEGYPLSERQVFRFVPDKTSTKSIHQRAAERIAEKYGKDLYRYCNMGKEANIYANALHCCMTQFSPDFRALLYNAPIFDTSKHIRKLKLQGEAPGLAVGGQSTSPDQFVKPFNSTNVDSLGVNLWQLLVMGSLIGNRDLHPKCSSDFARNVLALILQRAPRCATPGDKIPIRSFNNQSGRQEVITVDSANRTDFFIRPLVDDGFVQNGLFTYCRCDPTSGLLPEDVIHCPHLERATELLICKYWEVPASFLAGNYSLVPKLPYALHREGAKGGVRIDGLTIRITVYDTQLEEETVYARDITSDWGEFLKSLNCIVLPMIFRPSAAVWDETKTTVGIILPTSSAGENFDLDSLSYQAAFESNEEGPLKISLEALTVLKGIIPVGTTFWLKPDTDAWKGLAPKFPSYLRQDDLPTSAVRVRLNVPTVIPPDPTKLYVSVMQRPRGSPNGTVFSAKTITVDAWDLMPVGGAGFKEIPYIMQ